VWITEYCHRAGIVLINVMFMSLNIDKSNPKSI
jgi:hypothetical protein